MIEADKTTFAPFILVDAGHTHLLILNDDAMEAKEPVFNSVPELGFVGNGYDWGSIAQLMIDERYPELDDRLKFGSDAGMMSLAGSREDLQLIGSALQEIYNEDAKIIDALHRAEVD